MIEVILVTMNWFNAGNWWLILIGNEEKELSSDYIDILVLLVGFLVDRCRTLNKDVFKDIEMELNLSP